MIGTEEQAKKDELRSLEGIPLDAKDIEHLDKLAGDVKPKPRSALN